jgi:hypothetical protein
MVRDILISVAVFLALGGGVSFAWDPSDDLEDWYDVGHIGPIADGPEIRDPFFEFMVNLVEGDSLGVWTTDDILAYITASGRPSKLPVERLVSVSRDTVPLGEAVRAYHYPARRSLRLELDADLRLPLPYSILGYHPGTLHVSRVVETVEWNLLSATLRLPDDGDDPARIWAPSIKALGIKSGHVVLDVDGWVDRLLGKKIDDTWIEGFIVARISGSPDPQDNGLNGLVIGRSRKNRPLSGSFDFRRDKVLPNGRPVAKALARYCRHWVAPPDKTGPEVWSWKP